MPVQVVLISGKQGSGKSSTQAGLIAASKRAGFDFAVNYNFADAIYRFHDKILASLKDEFLIPLKHAKDGKLLQLLGTEWGRGVYGDDIWVEILKKRIHTTSNVYENKDLNILVVVGDCRFKNEFDAFPEALRVRLIASENTRKKRTNSWRDNTLHQSETDLDSFQHENKFDITIETDGFISVDGAVEMVVAQLQKKNWIEKRKK